MSFLSLIAYVACIYIRPQEIPGPLYATPVMTILAGIIFFFLIVRYTEGGERFFQEPQDFLIIGFWIAIIFSQLSNGYFAGTLKGFLEISRVVLLYFAISKLLDSEKKFKIFIHVMVLLSLYLAISGIAQYYAEIDLNDQTILQRRIRSVSIFDDPNDMGLTIILIAPFLITHIVNKSFMIFRMFNFFALAIIICATWLTNSRGGMLSLGVCLICCLYGKIKNILFIIGAILVLYIIMQYGPSRMSTISVTDESAHGRIVGMANGFHLLTRSFKTLLLGSGYDWFRIEYDFAAHNTFMHVAGEIGIVGLFFFVALFYVSIKGLLNLRKQKLDTDNSIVYLTKPILISFITLIFGTLFLSWQYKPMIYILIAVSVAMLKLCYSGNEKKEKMFSAKDGRNVLMIESIGLIVAYVGVRLFY